MVMWLTERQKVLAANGKEIYSDWKNREQLHKAEVYAVRFQWACGFSYFQHSSEIMQLHRLLPEGSEDTSRWEMLPFPFSRIS